MDKILKLNIVFYILSVFINKYFLQHFYSINFTYTQSFLIIGYLYLSIIVPFVVYVYYRNSELKIDVVKLFFKYKISYYDEEIENGSFDFFEKFNYEGIAKNFESIVDKYKKDFDIPIIFVIIILAGTIPTTLNEIENTFFIDYYWILIYNIISLVTILINSIVYFYNILIEERYHNHWALKGFFNKTNYKLVRKRNPFRYSYLLLAVHIIVLIVYCYHSYIK